MTAPTRPVRLQAPCIATTWSFGARANAAAWPLLAVGRDPLEAVLAAATAAEEDPAVDSVGWGGLPDAGGRVSLDACVMRSPSQNGSACGLRRHLHAAQVARLVMERTPHAMLVGPDADDFADAQGMPAREPLAPSARAAWEAWRASPEGAAAATCATMAAQARDRGLAGHDTIGTLAIGADGALAGACSTSGTPYKLPGRVGDSPIIGHGLYVDPGVGAATATGTGELIMGICGAFLAVEAMRRGADPAQAAREAVERIASSFRIAPHHQACFVALRADGAGAGAALRAGFVMALRDGAGERLAPPDFTLIPDSHPQEPLGRKDPS